MRSPSSASLTGLAVFRDSSPAKRLLCLGSRCCTTTIAGNDGPRPASTSLKAGRPPADAPIATKSNHSVSLVLRAFVLIGTALRFATIVVGTAPWAKYHPRSDYRLVVARHCFTPNNPRESADQQRWPDRRQTRPRKN